MASFPSAKLLKLAQRLEEVEQLLGCGDLLQDRKRYRALNEEHAYLSEVCGCHEKLKRAQQELAESRELLAVESDPAMAALLREEIAQIEPKIPKLEAELHSLLVPPDPLDHCNTILELRAGTGGDEAALFVGDCVRMYQLFANRMGWRCETLSASPSEMGGFREYIMVVTGSNGYRSLRNEGGTHRVQRVPETEAQGRIHTSTITVAVLPEPPEEETEVQLDEKELRIDTFRSSGAGGQHVNTTDSAVRITHLPTGLVVSSQQERSQHQNKEKAMRLLKAKILEQKRIEIEQSQASNRSQQVGTGERCERIRTYNFPQNRVTDHRINLTLYSLNRMLEGQLEELILALISHFRELALAAEDG